MNYYRLEVYGSTDFSSSRYLSGYFDPDAVASYFGEISASKDDQTFPLAAEQPAPNSTQSSKSATASQPVKDENLTSVDPRKQGRQLVMLLSSNSEAIADELGELASSKDLAVSIAAFAASSRSNQSQDAALATSAERSDAGRIMDLSDSVFATLGNSPTSAQLQSAMLMLVNRLCTELGARQTFADLPSAQRWLNENRERWEVMP